jgi:hypothetical protein
MILILTTARSGSTAICRDLSQRYDLNDLGEYLNVTTRQITADQKSIFIEELSDSIDQDLAEPWVIKIFPNHVMGDSVLTGLFEKICDRAQQIMILERRDRMAQIKSLYIAELLFDQGIGYHDQWQDPVTIPWDPTKWQQIQRQVDYDLMQLQLWKMRFRKDPRVSVITTDSVPGRAYNRPVQWDPHEPC